LNDPVRSGSYNMRVLRVLLKAERDDEWLTPRDIAVRAGIPIHAVGSRVRELRTDGFVIHRTRDRTGVAMWVYRLFFAGSN
jgi:RIO-like serine/threonine protein kinase